MKRESTTSQELLKGRSASASQTKNNSRTFLKSRESEADNPKGKKKGGAKTRPQTTEGNKFGIRITY